MGKRERIGGGEEERCEKLVTGDRCVIIEFFLWDKREKMGEMGVRVSFFRRRKETWIHGKEKEGVPI